MGKSTTTKTRAVFKASNTRFVQGLCRSGTVGGPAKSLHIRILKRKVSPGAPARINAPEPKRSSSSEPANRASPKAKTNPGLPGTTTPPARIKAPSAGPPETQAQRKFPGPILGRSAAYPISTPLAKWTKEDCDDWNNEHQRQHELRNFDACTKMSANLLGLDLNDLNKQKLEHTRWYDLTHSDKDQGPGECFTAVTTAHATLQSLLTLSSQSRDANGAPAKSPKAKGSPHDKPPHQISMSPLMSPHVLHLWEISPPARSPKPKGVVKKKRK